MGRPEAIPQATRFSLSVPVFASVSKMHTQTAREKQPFDGANMGHALGCPAAALPMNLLLAIGSRSTHGILCNSHHRGSRLRHDKRTRESTLSSQESLGTCFPFPTPNHRL